MKFASYEMIKEGFRLALFAAIAFFFTTFTQYLNALPQTDTTIIAVTFVLRLVDKWLAAKDTSILPSVKEARGISLI